MYFCVCIYIYLMCAIAEQSVSKVIFRVNYLLLALNGEMSYFGE